MSFKKMMSGILRIAGGMMSPGMKDGMILAVFLKSGSMVKRSLGTKIGPAVGRNKNNSLRKEINRCNP